MTDPVEIGCGHLPYRKNPCLYLIHDGRITPLAWFVDDEARDLWSAANPQYSYNRLQEAAAEFGAVRAAREAT